MKKSNIIVRDLTKSFNGQSVIDTLNIELVSGKTYCLMGSSGIGKTTFLRILLGLEQADSGTVTLQGGTDSNCHLTAVFQEDRLCETFSALENIMLVTGKTFTYDNVYTEICRLLPEECVTRPVNTLSGGMRRRVALLRAILAPSCGILMDEPFTGLDEDTKHMVINYIKEKCVGKLLVVVTHHEEDVAALEGQLITF